MCGIVGYAGKKNATRLLLDGLKRLEYRGYDSAGIALVSGSKLVVERCEGKIARLERAVGGRHIAGTVGVGHTRWATHGRPSEENAHPHTDCAKRLVVVHNGIIENYLELKKKLGKSGHLFTSETDTEVIAHLIESKLNSMKKKRLLTAVRMAVRELAGSYAIAAVSADEPDVVVAARQFSPLIVGLGDGEFFVASDIPAVLEHTRNIVPLEDGEIAELKSGGVDFYDMRMKKLRKKPTVIPWDPVTAEKGGFKHFMLKEIFEQPRTIEETLRGRISLESGRIYLEESNLKKEAFSSIKKIYFVACGTAFHAGMIGKYMVEEIAKLPCEVDLASEFRYRDPLIGRDTLFVAITQSGETADTLAAIREAKAHGARTLAICNVIGSSATREADGVIYTRTGPEIGVASTKAFTAQLTILYVLALFAARARGAITAKEATRLATEMCRIPKLVEKTLNLDAAIEECAEKYFKKRDFLYLGRNINFPIALEGALKLKEISYIHAEGYAAGEMKHGPIALIDDQMPVIVIATRSGVYEKIVSNIQEVKARRGIVIAIAGEKDKSIAGYGIDDVIRVPSATELLNPILNTVALQLFAYHVARFGGCDIDQPRNLAKSVVVE